MEVLIGVAAGILVVFLCLFCYRLGIKDGRAVKEDRPLEKAVNIPQVKPKQENGIEDQFNALMGYNPEFVETRGKE